jgi:hypothetical protein
MNVWRSIRSRLSGQTQEAFGSGQRFPLNKQIKDSIKRHVAGLGGKDLSQYTFERRHSDYPDSKSDLVIYDGEQRAVLNGREGSDGRLSIWSP